MGPRGVSCFRGHRMLGRTGSAWQRDRSCCGGRHCGRMTDSGPWSVSYCTTRRCRPRGLGRVKGMRDEVGAGPADGLRRTLLSFGNSKRILRTDERLRVVMMIQGVNAALDGKLGTGCNRPGISRSRACSCLKWDCRSSVASWRTARIIMRPAAFRPGPGKGS